MNRKLGLLGALLICVLVTTGCGLGDATGGDPQPTDTPTESAPEPTNRSITTSRTAEPRPAVPTTAPTVIPEMTESPALASTALPTTTLTISNESGVEIGHVYLAPSYTDQWGDDLLEGKVIADGESFTLTAIPSGVYDVKAETPAYVEIGIQYEQTFEGPSTWEVWGGDGRFLPRLDQWAFSAKASSEFSSSDWSAEQAIGELDTAECGHLPTAWASAAPDDVAWLEVAFRSPVVPRRINIYETHSPGFIVRVEVVDESEQYRTVWEGEPMAVDECPRVFSFLVTDIDLPVATVRIHVDQAEDGNWNQIDAVELVGIDQ